MDDGVVVALLSVPIDVLPIAKVSRPDVSHKAQAREARHIMSHERLCTNL